MHLCRSCSSVPHLPSILEMLQTLTFCSLLPRCTIPCACHAKRHLNVQKWSEPLVFLTFWLRNVLRATTACTFQISQLPKVVREWCVLYIFTLKCASRHPTTACTVSTSQLRKVVRSWCALSILTSKCASRHDVVQFFISHLASWLRTRRFSEPTFRPSRATNYWKNTVFCNFPTFSSTWIFFLLRLSLFWSSFFFSSLLFSDSSHLCFSSVHIVGSLTSKLPLIIIYNYITYYIYIYMHIYMYICIYVGTKYIYNRNMGWTNRKSTRYPGILKALASHCAIQQLHAIQISRGFKISLHECLRVNGLPMLASETCWSCDPLNGPKTIIMSDFWIFYPVLVP